MMCMYFFPLPFTSFFFLCLRILGLLAGIWGFHRKVHIWLFGSGLGVFHDSLFILPHGVVMVFDLLLILLLCYVHLLPVAIPDCHVIRRLLPLI